MPLLAQQLDEREQIERKVAVPVRSCLLGPSFTLADLNVASVLSTAIMARVDLRSHSHVSAWFAGSFQREAAKRTVEIFRSGK